MKIRTMRVYYATAGAGCAFLLAGAGCTPGEGRSAARPPSADSPAAPPSRPSASGIESDIAKVNRDTSLSPAQKQIMLDQMKHAQALPSGVGGK